MIRHLQNNNLTLYYQPFYQGLPIQTERGPLILEYLDSLKCVLDKSIMQYGRVFAFRFDLRFPVNNHQPYSDNNMVIERFISSFKAKIRHNRNKAIVLNKYAHDTDVRYGWCREMGQQWVPHFHFVMFLNNDAFCTLGQFEIGRQNIFNRLHEAWASALKVSLECVLGLVELPDHPIYRLQLDDPNSLAECFYRISYLCKADTKHYGNGIHGFGTSRI